jgi:hypothetical protein
MKRRRDDNEPIDTIHMKLSGPIPTEGELRKTLEQIPVRAMPCHACDTYTRGQIRAVHICRPAHSIHSSGHSHIGGFHLACGAGLPGAQDVPAEQQPGHGLR